MLSFTRFLRYITRPTKPTAGFTLLELMIATSVFAVILLVVTAGILSFTRQYYKGVVSSTTQTTAREIMSEITQSIQFGSNIQTDLTAGGGVEGFCVDNKLFSYKPGTQVTDNGGVAAQHQGYHALIRSQLASGCNSATAPIAMPNTANLLAGQRELVGNHMRLATLKVTPLAAGGPLYSVHVRVVYGDDDLLCSISKGDCSSSATSINLDKPDLACKGTIGSQFCAVSDLTTTVQKRLQ
ncbi:MAG TPA: prepilin-type N-terminal cleavage/methylation domain-containing protein [Candidatus Saccharimonadales bacterium]|nr:prepilin-type N-terminal cleavage/methylation domain-containing protein [Candidatus Saccharimonadales bacterium]